MGFNFRSGLFFPANREKFYEKAILTNPSCFCPDLEDSVSLQEKDTAIKMLKEKIKFLHNSKPNVKIMPRPNHISTSFHSDIDNLLTKENAKLFDGFVIPKISSGDEFAEIDLKLTEKEKEYDLEHNHFQIVVAIETTLGIINCTQILRGFKNRIFAAGFGADDFSSDFGIIKTPAGLSFPKKYLALACHAENVLALNTPFVEIKNLEGLKKSIEEAKLIGFKGQFCIHPTHVDMINEEYCYTKEQIEYSQILCEEFEKARKEGKSAINFKGIMIDEAVYKRELNIAQS
jgi:citrate lyase subunit beta / citryl-CoA lyase